MLVASTQVFAGTKDPDETILINQASVLDAGGFLSKLLRRATIS